MSTRAEANAAANWSLPPPIDLCKAILGGQRAYLCGTGTARKGVGNGEEDMSVSNL